MADEEFHRIVIAGVVRDLPKVKVADGLTIAALNTLGDTELVEAAAEKLCEKLKDTDFNFIVTPEAKSIPIAHAMSVRMEHRPYVVLRKTYKSYMGDALENTTHSITTGKAQTLFLDGKDRTRIHKRKVVILDDVISTGSTLEAMRQLMDLAGGEVVAICSILTEGDESRWTDVISLGHLPVWTTDLNSAS